MRSRFTCRRRASDDLEVLARALFERQAGWIRALTLGARCGDGDAAAAARGSVIGYFPLLSKSAGELVVGEDDRHLDFRVAILLRTGAAGGREIVVVTVVRCHNRLGRTYLAVIAPFHRTILAGEFGTGGKGDGGIDRFYGDAEDWRGFRRRLIERPNERLASRSAPGPHSRIDTFDPLRRQHAARPSPGELRMGLPSRGYRQSVAVNIEESNLLSADPSRMPRCVYLYDASLTSSSMRHEPE